MQMHPVQSSNVVAVGYDDGTNSLHVQFKGNTVYIYTGVPPEKFNALLQSDSKGKFINSNIKGSHPFTKAA